jgi:hypothetical protein|tara:strand:+ start:1746 stop:1952 length:207 start_codon:yes stop_codon:yes gene_type:complete
MDEVTYFVGYTIRFQNPSFDYSSSIIKTMLPIKNNEDKEALAEKIRLEERPDSTEIETKCFITTISRV